MINVALFILHASLIMGAVLVALRFGKQALMTLIATQWILANLLVTKQISLLGFNVTATDAFIVGAGLGLNLMQEHFGKEAARRTIWVSFGCSIFYLLMSQLHLWYLPSVHDTMHPAYSQILSFAPRIVIASLATYLIVQHLNFYLFAHAQKLFGTQRLVRRVYFTEILTQFADTILFSFLGLYGIMENVGHIILISFTVKVAVILVAGPFAALSRHCVPKK